MKLRVLGCDGGKGIGYNTTSLLFNDTVLIDAGTIQSQLTIEEALKITDIFLTHSHLDHIIDLPFLLDATFEQRVEPLRLHGLPETLDPLMEHIFNNTIWPDFSVLPKQGQGQFALNYITPEEMYEINGLTITPVEVNHTIPTVGYRIEDADSALIFTGDTGPTDRLWEVANATDNLKAVIIDLSFPTTEQTIADISKHMTASDVESELKKLKKECDVYTFHFKVSQGALLEGQAKRVTHFGKPLKALREVKELVI
jgi:ribonuclease BN (tRNA processing enzyme)